MNRNLYLLAGCQGLFLTNNIIFIAINGLIGLSLAPLGWMATLPVMGYVVGGALSTALVARTQSAWGRKVSFQLGLVVALVSALLCAYAVFEKNFWLLVVVKGTRVPIESLFDHLEGGANLDEFLEDFPSVSREQATKVLALAESVLQSNLKLLHESAA